LRNGKLLGQEFLYDYILLYSLSEYLFGRGPLTFRVLQSIAANMSGEDDGNPPPQPAEFEEALPEKVRVSQILVKHQKSRKLTSWKDKNGDEMRNRTVDEACEQLKHLRHLIDSGQAKFADVAAQWSDCGSAKKGGDLGFIKPGEMQQAFEDVAFRLKLFELSDVVQTDSGCHLILRTG